MRMAATHSSSPRTWSSLITDRWHRSSCVVFWSVLLLMLLSNLPGHFVMFVHYDLGHPFYLDNQCAHGWPATTGDLSHLCDLPNLEALSFNGSLEVSSKWPATPAELPPLPQLRGLYIAMPARGCRRLDRLTGLTDIRITDGNVDDQALRELSQLRNLQRVALNGLETSADLSFLPKLPQLTGVDFYNSNLSDEALQHIGECSGLQEASLYMCGEVDDRCIPRLIKLTQLRKLNLQYTKVQDITRIQQALPKCNIKH